MRLSPRTLLYPQCILTRLKVILLSVVKAILTFAPALILSRLLKSLEASDSGARSAQIWLCVGLAGSVAASGVLQSHLTLVSSPRVISLAQVSDDQTTS